MREREIGSKKVEGGEGRKRKVNIQHLSSCNMNSVHVVLRKRGEKAEEAGRVMVVWE